MPAPETFCDVLEHLNRENARYVVVSGFAVVMHGHKRDIVDLDVVTDPSPREAQRCMRALAVAGFMPSIPLPLEMVSVLRLFDRLSREVDVFVRYLIPFEELWSGSESMKVGNQMVRIAALEHVVQVKRTLSRPHDLADIEALMRIKNERLISCFVTRRPRTNRFCWRFTPAHVSKNWKDWVGMTIRREPLLR